MSLLTSTNDSFVSKTSTMNLILFLPNPLWNLHIDQRGNLCAEDTENEKMTLAHFGGVDFICWLYSVVRLKGRMDTHTKPRT